MARWLSGAPAATEAAQAACTACSTSPATAGTAGTLVAARGPREHLTSCVAISTVPMNATAGQAEISAPSSRLVGEVVLLDAVRGRISELSRKQQG